MLIKKNNTGGAVIPTFFDLCLIKKKHKGIFNVGSNESFSNIYIAKSICKILNKNPKKYIRNDLLKTGIKERVIADFIAGMTDRFAINLNRNFK